MANRTRRLVALVPTVAALACGASSEPAAVPGAGSACTDLADSARKEVMAAITANASCSVDAECEAIAFSSSCFDSCTRATSKAGVAAVTAAKTRVDGEQCAKFRDQGCRSITPPCAPPAAPRCVAGACQ